MVHRLGERESRVFPGLAEAVLDQFETSRGAWRQPILTVDSHTAGEPTRLVVGGLPPIPGETMNDKRLYLANEMDYVRGLLTREPRGHRDMFGAVLTEPVSPEAAFGLVYMDARRYPYLCGHATIGAVTTLIEAGVIETEEPETIVFVDSPSDTLTMRARVKEGQVQSVAFRAEAAFAYELDQPLEVPGLGSITVDTVCVGGFFVMIAADQIDIPLVPERTDELARLGMRIIDLANEQLDVRHPAHPYVDTVDVAEFYGPTETDGADGKNAVVFGQAHVDRSPCGTGTSAKLALLHRRGELDVGDTYVNEGILGTTFEACIVAEERVGGLPAIVPEARGTAHITGVHQFLLDTDDPFPKGFLLK